VNNPQNSLRLSQRDSQHLSQLDFQQVSPARNL
jgi:hypothetical protein